MSRVSIFHLKCHHVPSYLFIESVPYFIIRTPVGVKTMCRIKYESLPIVFPVVGEFDEMFSDDEDAESDVDATDATDEDDLSWLWMDYSFDSTPQPSATDSDTYFSHNSSESFSHYDEEFNLSENVGDDSLTDSYEGDYTSSTDDQTTAESMSISGTPNSSCENVENGVDVESFSLTEDDAEETIEYAVFNDPTIYFICIGCAEVYNELETHQCNENVEFDEHVQYLDTEYLDDSKYDEMNCPAFEGFGLNDVSNFDEDRMDVQYDNECVDEQCQLYDDLDA